jgi:ATP-binding cassette subfamily F protein 2
MQVLVSHDFRLISQVAQEIWVVGDNTVTKWQGTIEEYKEHLKATHEALNESKNVVKKEMTER